MMRGPPRTAPSGVGASAVVSGRGGIERALWFRRIADLVALALLDGRCGDAYESGARGKLENGRERESRMAGCVRLRGAGRVQLQHRRGQPRRRRHGGPRARRGRHPHRRRRRAPRNGAFGRTRLLHARGGLGPHHRRIRRGGDDHLQPEQRTGNDHGSRVHVGDRESALRRHPGAGIRRDGLRTAPRGGHQRRRERLLRPSISRPESTSPRGRWRPTAPRSTPNTAD